MIIAIPYENGMICQHFGHAPQFKFYRVEGNEVVSSYVADMDGIYGHGAISEYLSDAMVDVVLCGNIGSGSTDALDDYGIEYFSGVNGNPDEAVLAFLDSHLEYDPNARCNHQHKGGCSGCCSGCGSSGTCCH